MKACGRFLLLVAVTTSWRIGMAEIAIAISFYLKDGK